MTAGKLEEGQLLSAAGLVENTRVAYLKEVLTTRHEQQTTHTSKQTYINTRTHTFIHTSICMTQCISDTRFKVTPAAPKFIQKVE